MRGTCCDGVLLAVDINDFDSCARFDRTVSGRFAQMIWRTVPSARSTLKASRRFFHPRDPAGREDGMRIDFSPAAE